VPVFRLSLQPFPSRIALNVGPPRPSLRAQDFQTSCPPLSPSPTWCPAGARRSSLSVVAVLSLCRRILRPVPSAPFPLAPAVCPRKVIDAHECSFPEAFFADALFLSRTVEKLTCLIICAFPSSVMSIPHASRAASGRSNCSLVLRATCVRFFVRR